MDNLGPLENTSVSEDSILKKTPIIGVIVTVVMLII